MFFCGRFVGAWAIIKTFAPFAVIATLGGFFGRLVFLAVWGGLALLCIAIFVCGQFMQSKRVRNRSPV
jgi:hypothetical protein